MLSLLLVLGRPPIPVADVVLANGETISAAAVEERGDDLVLHVEGGTIVLPKAAVASHSGPAPAAAESRPDRVALANGSAIEGVVTAERTDEIVVRVAGGTVEVGRSLVERVAKGTLAAADLDGADAAARDADAAAETDRREAAARYRSELAVLTAERFGARAVPASARISEAADAVDAALVGGVEIPYEVLWSVERAFRKGPYPDRVLARQAAIQVLFPGYVAPIYSPITDVLVR